MNDLNRNFGTQFFIYCSHNSEKCVEMRSSNESTLANKTNTTQFPSNIDGVIQFAFEFVDESCRKGFSCVNIY